MPIVDASAFASTSTPTAVSPATRMCWMSPSGMMANGSALAVENRSNSAQYVPGSMLYFFLVTPVACRS